MTGLLNAKNAFEPGSNLMTGRIGWFVQINKPTTNVFLYISLLRGTSERKRGVVVCSHVHFVEVFEQKGPFCCTVCCGFFGGHDENLKATKSVLSFRMLYNIPLQDAATLPVRPGESYWDRHCPAFLSWTFFSSRG